MFSSKQDVFFQPMIESDGKESKEWYIFQKNKDFTLLKESLPTTFIEYSALAYRILMNKEVKETKTSQPSDFSQQLLITAFRRELISEYKITLENHTPLLLPVLEELASCLASMTKTTWHLNEANESLLKVKSRKSTLPFMLLSRNNQLGWEWNSVRNTFENDEFIVLWEKRKKALKASAELEKVISQTKEKLKCILFLQSGASLVLPDVPCISRGCMLSDEESPDQVSVIPPLPIQPFSEQLISPVSLALQEEESHPEKKISSLATRLT